MWARIEDNKIVEYYSQKKSIVLNNVRYSSQIFTIWTDAQRKDLGIVPVVISGSRLNSKYYIEDDPSDAIAGDGNSVIRTIGVKLGEKDLNDINEVWTQSEIDDGQAPGGTSANDPKLDADGNQIVIKGLKTEAKETANTRAHTYLKRFSWLVERKVTADIAIPNAVVTYMENIRTDHKNICDAIDGASDMNAFIALHNDTYKADGTIDTIARVNRWTNDSNVKSYRR
jgi:hypothetical protein